MKYDPLTRDEVASVIAGNGAAARVPILLHTWVHPEQFGDRQGAVEEILRQYPCDAQFLCLRMPAVHDAPAEHPEYRWVNYDKPPESASRAIDAQIAIDDWAKLDGILAHFPDPNCPALLPAAEGDDGRYRVVNWWFCLFERFWSLRGMTNSLMDFHTNPAEVHRLFRTLTDFYLVAIERAKSELAADAIFVSDDLGTQTGPFFSPEIFREFFKPYYAEMFDKAHSLGMTFWLHCCGNIEIFLREWIEIGLDVIHPIQKYTMDEKTIAEKFGEAICIWGGFDVQRTIPWGTPQDVRREVRFMMDTYCRPQGRFMFTAGNGVNGDCPLGSLEALFDEAFRYGAEISPKS